MQPVPLDTTHTVRTASATDLAGIRVVDSLMRADPDRARLIQSALRTGECMVAVDGDEVLGFDILNYTFFQQGSSPCWWLGWGAAVPVSAKHCYRRLSAAV
jgi:hypothetical protein